jgi:hypothetical protein
MASGRVHRPSSGGDARPPFMTQNDSSAAKNDDWAAFDDSSWQ